MKLVSLFSGAMGLDIGLETAGFTTIACVENDPFAVKTIQRNKPKVPVLADSIANVTGAQLRETAGLSSTDDIELVAGGPPCQSFSVFGNRNGIEDSRGQLVFEFVRIISELQPHTFVMENVRGLLSMSIVPKSKAENLDWVKPEFMQKGSLLNRIFKKFETIGYRVDCYVVNSVNYGAPQIRERLILVGNRHNLLSTFPEPQYSNRPEDNLPPFKTLGDVIGNGFKDTCPEVLNFSPRKLKYLAMVPQGGNWRSLPIEIQKESMGKSWYLKGGRSAYWRKLSFAFPSPTVVTMPNHAGTSMCHPTELRAISIGEAAAIQEFPSEWIFEGSTSAKFKQIGNAVPVRLGTIAGKEVMKLLKRITNNETENIKLSQNRIIHLRPHVRTRTFWKNGKVYTGDTGYYNPEQQSHKSSEMEAKQLEFDFLSH
ncbi:MAG: DNA cytosine methyltransferase [Deltaproteobacteria bacterium]|nr:DNA cytosine methyltransferase [Deltaproteobacteria bacterium]